MATTATAAPGKTSFVKQFLNDHPEGTTKTVNEAWQAAGMKGTISHPIISQVRKQLGLTGNLRGKIRTAAKGKAAPNMPGTATATPGKTMFVKQFLNDHPEGTTKTVNEAWQAAGMKGTISHPIISQVRKQLGLTGKLRGKIRTAAKGKAAPNMPRTATATPGKTMFVKQFLNDHPEGTTKTVNEAWQAAGFEGTISPTLVNKTRVKMNLTGNLRGNSETAAKEEAAPNKPKTATATPGKTSFLKEFLHDNPQGNFKSVNEAWTAAGFNGTISEALVYKARASLGLTGNLSGKTKKSKAKTTSTGKKLGRARKETTAPVTGKPRGRKSARTLALTELEADIDLLIFKVMGIGDLSQIEETLRQARRQLYATANGR